MRPILRVLTLSLLVLVGVAAPVRASDTTTPDARTALATHPEGREGEGFGAAAAEDGAQANEATSGRSLFERVDAAFGQVNARMASVIFYPIPIPFTKHVDRASGQAVLTTIPVAVLLLVLGAIFFTVRMGLPQLKSFGHAIDVVRGRYDKPGDEGEVSSFQALTAALSATVGLGNIAGVAIAVATGGPGATFWMILAGFLGMASKFTECTLGQMYRETRPDGRVMGGAMFYLSKGLAEMGLGGLGKLLAVFFAVVCIGASFGGGNTFQVNQSLGAVSETIPFLHEHPWVYGLVMSALIGVVILGGFRRIATTAEKIVPLMCGVYVLACLVILVLNATKVPWAFGQILAGALDTEALYGGAIGVLVTGFKRAAFSNEAGIGSAAIAHAAARVPHPSREGIVALLEPFIDTIVVCTMTALVIVITGAYSNPDYQGLIAANRGAALTSNAMGSQISFFPYVLSLSVMLFAYSTCISWSYYGERCWAYLFGDGTSMVYRLIFVVFAFLGSIVTATNILDFGDLLIFGMVLPNIIGVVLLSGKVRRAYDDYQQRLASGQYEVNR